MSKQTGKKKPGLVKQAERRFFHYFNDKSTGRRVVFMGMLAVAPTYAVSGIFNEDASTRRADDSAAVVSMQNYQREIDSISRVTPLVQASPQIQQRARDLATNVVLDPNLSEVDKRRLATTFLQKTDMPSTSLAEGMFKQTRSTAPYLQNSLKVTFNEPQLANSSKIEKANYTLSESFFTGLMDKSSDYFIAYFIFFSFFEVRARRILAKGREKDEKLKQEVRTETAEEKLERLKELLTPKSGGNGPKP